MNDGFRARVLNSFLSFSIVSATSVSPFIAQQAIAQSTLSAGGSLALCQRINRGSAKVSKTRVQAVVLSTTGKCPSGFRLRGTLPSLLDVNSIVNERVATVSKDPGPQGPEGEVGPTGPQGPIGLTGSTGARGEIGPQGLQGPIGPTGPQGEVGATGPQGLQGIQGEAGPIGPIGPQGQQGPQGIQGEVGPMGPQGQKGDPGATGPQGSAGPAGAMGPIGVQGPQGPVGPSCSVSSTDNGAQINCPGGTSATVQHAIPYATVLNLRSEAGTVSAPSWAEPGQLMPFNQTFSVPNGNYLAVFYLRFRGIRGAWVGYSVTVNGNVLGPIKHYVDDEYDVASIYAADIPTLVTITNGQLSVQISSRPSGAALMDGKVSLVRVK